MSYVLRPYQDKAIGAVQQRIERGINANLLVLATGLGKMVIVSHLPEKVLPTPCLFLAHRDELLKQAYEKIHAVNPHLHCSIEKAEHHASRFSDVVIASVQTLGRAGSKRVARFKGKIRSIIIDEAHHFLPGGIYDNVIQALQPEQVVGLTATPNRSDKIGLEHGFKDIAFVMTLRDGIEQGWLCDLDVRRVKSTTSLDNVHIVRGDFKESELSRAIDTDERNNLIVRSWFDYARGLSTLVYCSNVAHARHVTELFWKAGEKAEMVIGTTPPEMRAAIDARYKSGETKVVVNVGVYTEGYDAPGTRCVLMGAPTRSETKYIQMIGRGTRPFCDINALNAAETATDRLTLIDTSEKPSALIIDVVDNSKKNSAIQVPTLFGLNREVKTKGKTMVRVAKEIEDLVKKTPGASVEKVKDISRLKAMQTKALKVNVFKQATPTEVKKYSRYNFQEHGDKAYQISLNKHIALVLKEDALGQWEAIEESTADYDESKKQWVARETRSESLAFEPTLEGMFKRADHYIETYFPENTVLLKQDAAWRHKPVKETQIALLQRLRVQIEQKDNHYFLVTPEGKLKLNRGKASDLISARLDKVQHARV